MNILRAQKNRAIRLAGFFLAAAVFVFNFSDGMTAVRNMPRAVFTASSEELPAVGESFISAVPASGSGDETLGAGRLRFSLFGFISLADIPVYGSERPELCPLGCAAGISIRTRGVLIVGFGAVADKNGRERCPAEECGLRAGDLIMSVNGGRVFDSAELALAVDADSGRTVVEYERGGRCGTVECIPAVDRDGHTRLGAWVRDSTVGIGTMSFYDPASDTLAALGHAVTDADTGTILPVRTGEFVKARLIGISRGAAGMPGELRGTFSGESERLGSVLENCVLGVYGVSDGETGAGPGSGLSPMPLAFPNEVHTGDAYILSEMDGAGVQRFACRIVRAADQAYPEEKGLVIEITDSELIALSGGIVQGMSGSPIIQDGRLAGVVTHVFVNDPLRGYGVYACWMYQKAVEQMNKSTE